MAEVLELTRPRRGRPPKAAGAPSAPASATPPKTAAAPIIIAEAASAAGMGDNLTPEQEAKALRIYHVTRLRAQLVKVDAAKAAYDAERQVMTDLFHLAKADTKYARKELQALLEAMSGSKTELREAEERRARLWADWDLPVGHQGDLFEKLPREAADHEDAKGVGYAAGLRGDPCVMPEGMQPRFGQAFGEGWGKGQEELAWALAAAGVIVDRKKGAGGGPTREEIERQPEDEDEFDPDAEARKLKAGGFLETASPSEEPGDAQEEAGEDE